MRSTVSDAAVIEDQETNLVEDYTSNEFMISNHIEVELTVNKESFFPSDKITIEGSAIGYNGEKMNGQATITFENIYHVDVEKGEFEFEESIYKKIKSGEHEILVRVEDGEGNFGDGSLKIDILPVPTSIEISLNKTLFDPGENIEADAVLLDQAGEEIDSEIILTLYDSWGGEMKRQNLEEGVLKYSGKSSDAPGNWWIYANRWQMDRSWTFPKKRTRWSSNPGEAGSRLQHCLLPSFRP